MDLEISGSSAILTASSSGLGKESAKSLAREGANVVINGRDSDRLSDAASEIRAVATGEVLTEAGDITDPETSTRLIERTVDSFGGLDIVVTSAGGPPPMRPLEPADSDWYDTFELLVLSVVRLIRESTDHLTADNGGAVVHITSMAAKEPSMRNVLSSSVRPSVIGFEKTLAAELAPDVRVNAVLPGAHDTPRIQEMGMAAVERGEYETYEDVVQNRAASIPLNRIGNAGSFGDLVAFLCSDRASFITGAAIPVDGGVGSTMF